MKFYTLSVFLLLFSLTSFGQNDSENVFHDPGHLNCGHNRATEAYFEAHPEAVIQAEQDRAEFNARVRDNEHGTSRDADFIIPVVFHIIHVNGPENISDEQVQSAIDVLNEDFSASTPGIDEVQPAFANIVGNPNVEFRLAKKDPSGNCTNGINRVYSDATNDGGDNVKSGEAATWGRTKYLNIWVVNDIQGDAAGYAYLPWGAPSQYDGIIIEDAYVGRIGTGNSSRSHALSHEAGHWAGLLHTWGQSDTPGLSSNCGGDDDLQDTPNTIGWSTCDLDGSSCGSLDNVENFMDYAYCYKMFTEDQASLMRQVLEFGPAGRNLLNSPTNHSNTGVLAPDVVCLADFTTTEIPVICEGGAVNFEDMSYNGITEWEWTFEGGSPSSSNAQNPMVTYNTPGDFDVSLTVSNANGSMSVSRVDHVRVLPIGENQVPFQEGFESFSSIDNNNENWSVTNSQDEGIEWKLNTNASYSGSKSVYVQGRQNGNGEIETLLSPTYDLTTIDNDAGEDVIISFKYAHAKRNSFTSDVFRVLVSPNCGETWSQRMILSGDDLPTVSGNVSTEFVPNSQSDWQEVVLDNVLSSYLTNNFRVKFEFTSGAGNNIYIDDINIYNSSEGPLSSSDITFASDITLYPNPTQGSTVLDYNLVKSSKVNIEILDLSGRVISQVFEGNLSSGNQRIDIQTGGLAKGVYMVRVTSDGEQFVKKLIRQ